MSDTTFPSKTDSEPQKPDAAPPVPPPSEVVPLLQSEIDYLKQMDDKDRFLAVLIGEKTVDLQNAVDELQRHRSAMKDTLSYTLTAHGIFKGRIDFNTGIITVLQRTAN